MLFAVPVYEIRKFAYHASHNAEKKCNNSTRNRYDLVTTYFLTSSSTKESVKALMSECIVPAKKNLKSRQDSSSIVNMGDSRRRVTFCASSDIWRKYSGDSKS